MYVSPSVLIVYGLPRFGDNGHEDITATPVASIMADNKTEFISWWVFTLRFIVSGAHLFLAVIYRVMA